MSTTKFEIPSSLRFQLDWLSSNIEVLPVRVKDIILDSSHPEYSKYLGPESIGAIKYSLIDRNIDTSDTKTLGVAFPANRNFTTFPVKDEIVLLVKGPKEDLQKVEETRFTERVDYYLPVLGIFNQVNTNRLPDSSDNSRQEPSFSSEEVFDEIDTIRPLHPFNGDILLQGRNGQSIRFTGAISKNNPFTDTTNKQNPLTIISNGHPENSINSFHIENINLDKSSIYLTSNHTIPLTQSKVKYGGAKERPTLSDKYKGAQIVVNSGRLFFNSHTDDIQFTATTDFGVSAANIYMDSENYVAFDAPKIYLGEKAKQFERQPVILGDQLEVFLRELLTALERTGKAMTKAKTIDAKPIPLLNLEGVFLEQIAKGLNNRINPGGKSSLKSDTTFTE